jgi:hypothetical protein
MATALISALASIVIVLITVVGQWIGSRNDRALTLQEVELLSRIDPTSEAAGDLNWVIDRRIAGWRSRYSPARALRRLTWRVTGLLMMYLIFGFAISFATGSLELWYLVPLLPISLMHMILGLRTRFALNAELKLEAERAKRRNDWAAALGKTGHSATADPNPPQSAQDS